MSPEQTPRRRADARRQETGREAPRHQERSWRTRWLPAIKLAAITLAVVLVSGASVSAFAVWQLADKVSGNSLDISNGEDPAKAPKVGSFEGGFNVLIVGVDNSEDQAEAFGERDATLNDVNIMLHVSDDHKSAVVLSLPRDLKTAQPECTDPETGEVSEAVESEAMNSSFSRGGLGCVVSTVSEATGLEIPYAGLISFQGTVAMADAVGGVPICLTEPIEDKYTGLDLPAGQNVVAGETALQYLRSRHGVGDGSDLSRISSQQAYMSSLMRVMKSGKTLTDPAKLSGLANAAATNLKLSESMASIPTMVSMALALKDLDLNKLVFVQYPSVTDEEEDLLPKEDLANELFAKIKADEPFTLDAEALGDGAEADPAGPPAPAPEAPAPEPAPEEEEPVNPDLGEPAPEPSVDPDAPPAGPEELGGLRGQTGSQQTCSVAAE